MQETLSSSGRFKTEHASKYLQQLCKHFGHKVEATYDAERGEVALFNGPCRMKAEPDLLVIEVEAGDEDALQRSREIVDNHLARFAFREEFSGMEWD